MTGNDPVETLIDLTARLIARDHLRHCSTQTQKTVEQRDSTLDSESSIVDDTSFDQPDSKGEKS